MTLGSGGASMARETSSFCLTGEDSRSLIEDGSWLLWMCKWIWLLDALLGFWLAGEVVFFVCCSEG